MCAVLLLFLILFEPIDSTAKAYLNEAYKILNIEEYELGFKKSRTERDTFRLSIVDSLMKQPLELPVYLASSADTIMKKAGKIGELTRFLLGELDLKLGKKYEYRVERKKRIKPEEFIVALLNGFLDDAALHMEKAFKALSRGEIDTLLYISVSLWSDEDDSTDDTLRGILLKEAGFEIDSLYDVETDTLLRILKKIERDELGRAIESFANGIESLVKFVEMNRDSLTPGLYSTNYGTLLIGSREDEYYEADSFPFIIDLGGNDRYRGRAGGSIGFLEPFNSFSIVIDIGGDDIYEAKNAVSLGASVLSLGALIDLSGNDVYRGSHLSIGAGLLGAGYLVDYGGDDIYSGGFFTMGAGNFGVGVLIDFDGNDSYRAIDWTEGFGSVLGYGLLYDKNGNDSYYAGGHYIHHPLLPKQYRSFAQGFAMGWRKPASGGIGFLLDRAGNDNHYVEVYGQGTSYWYSLGMLADLKGNDTYEAAEYAQGAGIHLSLGILYDGEGDDQYFSRFGPSMGEGHDFAVGILIDGKGNDSYLVSGGLGIGLTNSFGLFIDYEGDDVYQITEKLGLGDANWKRDMGGIGIFLDLGGNDVYPPHKLARNSRYWMDGTYGCGIDVEASKQ